MRLMAAAHHAPALAVAARKTAQTAATAQYGAVRVGVQHKRNPPLKGAATAVRKQELARQIAVVVVAARGARVRGKLVPPQQNPLQVKLAATAAQEQEPFPATVIRERGQHLLGVHARGKAFALQMQLKAAEAAVRKHALLPASGQAPA